MVWDESRIALIKNVGEDSTNLLVKAHIFGGNRLLPNKGSTEQIIKGHKNNGRDSGRIRQESRISDGIFAVEDEAKVIKPPYDLDALAHATLISSRLAKSIDIMAKNVVGLGFDVVDTLSTQERRNIDKATAIEIKKQKTNLEDFLREANQEHTFDALMSLVKVDEESVGNGYLEILRDNENDIKNLQHIPGRTIRLTRLVKGKSTDGEDGTDREDIDEEDVIFVQLRGTRKRYFIPFGSDLLIDSRTGEEIEGDVLREDVATELLHFKLTHPSDDFYGIPRWIPAIPSITGNRLSDVRNISFMENDATPRLAILVSGGNLDPSSVEAVEKFIDLQGRGVENASRVMVLQTERKMVGPQAGDPPKIELVPLTVGIQDDASFLKYRQANNDEIKEVFGISDLFYGMSRDINRAAASVSKQVTNEQEFEPERERITNKLKHILFPELSFDTDLVSVKFGSPLINDLASLADGISKASAAGGLTPHDIRELAGREPYPKTAEYDWADYPLPIATLFIQGGVFGITDSDDDEPQRQPGNRPPGKPPKGNDKESDESGETEEDDKESENEQKGLMTIAIENMKRLSKNRIQRIIKDTVKQTIIEINNGTGDDESKEK